MRAPVSLLRSFVDISVDPKNLADLMNGRIAEVEHVLQAPSREALADICVAKLLEVVEENDEWALWLGTPLGWWGAFVGSLGPPPSAEASSCLSSGLPRTAPICGACASARVSEDIV